MEWVGRHSAESFWETAFPTLLIELGREVPLVNRGQPPTVDWLSGGHVTQAGQSDLPDGGPRTGGEVPSRGVKKQRGQGKGDRSRRFREPEGRRLNFTSAGASCLSHYHLPSLSFCICEVEPGIPVAVRSLEVMGAEELCKPAVLCDCRRPCHQTSLEVTTVIMILLPPSSHTNVLLKPGIFLVLHFLFSLLCETFGYSRFSILHRSLIFHILYHAPGWAPDGQKNLPLFLQSNYCQHPVSDVSGSRRSHITFSQKAVSALNEGKLLQLSEQRHGMWQECLGPLAPLEGPVLRLNLFILEVE